MKIGAMNNPMQSLPKQIQWIGENRFDFVDLTLEPPGAYAADVNVDVVRELLDKYRLEVVGHTAYYLPIASPFPSFCELALEELRKCFLVFQMLDVRKVNLHADESIAGIFSKDRAIVRNIRAIKRAAEEASRYGLKLMLENTPRFFNSVEELQMLFDAVEDLGFHLDVAHANLNTEKNKTPEFLANFHDRLEHIHLSDNRGGTADLHLPLGAGLIPWNRIIAAIKEFEYDGTITLEVFSRDRRYLLASREKLLELWTEAQE
jgi:sugar phosphate isomerase/epimerase